MRGNKRHDNQPQAEDTATKGTPQRLADVNSGTSPPSRRGRADKVELDTVDADYVSSLLLEAENELRGEQKDPKSQHAIKSALVYIKSADQLAVRQADRLEKQRQEIKSSKDQVLDGYKERKALRKQMDALLVEASKLGKANAQLRQTLQTRDADLQYLRAHVQAVNDQLPAPTPVTIKLIDAVGFANMKAQRDALLLTVTDYEADPEKAGYQRKVHYEQQVQKMKQEYKEKDKERVETLESERKWLQAHEKLLDDREKAREEEKEVLDAKVKMLKRELNKARAEGGKVVVQVLE
ncbi:hypothetical protein Tdes44962_MAKER04894 [Teratosphaeria destructans]|uniref:Uncharacterized protein n=1 Tax=Teratosphaeria destructans TaxID=418781 RepID=A0A9W7VZU1_9PEZI|nr:hypothetical protein Tdes44962_MAKER04894 [Teratosphaeria destructans]